LQAIPTNTAPHISNMPPATNAPAIYINNNNSDPQQSGDGGQWRRVDQQSFTFRGSPAKECDYKMSLES
jgi:hypothetical protein